MPSKLAICQLCKNPGPERGPKALAAGWHARKGGNQPPSWLCPPCKEIQDEANWEQAKKYREDPFAGAVAEHKLTAELGALLGLMYPLHVPGSGR